MVSVSLTLVTRSVVLGDVEGDVGGLALLESSGSAVGAADDS